MKMVKEGNEKKPFRNTERRDLKELIGWRRGILLRGRRAETKSPKGQTGDLPVKETIESGEGGVHNWRDLKPGKG